MKYYLIKFNANIKLNKNKLFCFTEAQKLWITPLMRGLKG